MDRSRRAGIGQWHEYDHVACNNSTCNIYDLLSTEHYTAAVPVVTEGWRPYLEAYLGQLCGFKHPSWVWGGPHEIPKFEGFLSFRSIPYTNLDEHPLSRWVPMPTMDEATVVMSNSLLHSVPVGVVRMQGHSWEGGGEFRESGNPLNISVLFCRVPCKKSTSHKVNYLWYHSYHSQVETPAKRPWTMRRWCGARSDLVLLGGVLRSDQVPFKRFSWNIHWIKLQEQKKKHRHHEDKPKKMEYGAAEGNNGYTMHKFDTIWDNPLASELPANCQRIESKQNVTDSPQDRRRTVLDINVTEYLPHRQARSLCLLPSPSSVERTKSFNSTLKSHETPKRGITTRCKPSHKGRQHTVLGRKWIMGGGGSICTFKDNRSWSNRDVHEGQQEEERRTSGKTIQYDLQCVPHWGMPCHAMRVPPGTRSTQRPTNVYLVRTQYSTGQASIKLRIRTYMRLHDGPGIRGEVGGGRKCVLYLY